MRGDPPQLYYTVGYFTTSTPHARGSTVMACSWLLAMMVYPACAGIHLCSGIVQPCRGCLPRMRGDPPFDVSQFIDRFGSTPHARGSTPRHKPLGLLFWVYPACAGIHHTRRGRPPNSPGLPRMRGDPPVLPDGWGGCNASTPHARGSTPGEPRTRGTQNVYPACAGIHPHSKR